MEEIDAIQEKIGGRLNSINTMIANFPPDDPSVNESQTKTQNSPESTTSPAEASTPKPEKFALFAQQVAANNLEAAGQTLAGLLEVDPTTGLRCATAFRERLNEDPTIIQKTMLLRAKLIAGENNDSLMILWDCFRLQGLEAVEVLQTLKTRLANV